LCPKPRLYREIMNTDAAHYAVRMSATWAANNQPTFPPRRPNSLVLTLPPLAAVYLKWIPKF